MVRTQTIGQYILDEVIKEYIDIEDISEDVFNNIVLDVFLLFKKRVKLQLDLKMFEADANFRAIVHKLSRDLLFSVLLEFNQVKLIKQSKLVDWTDYINGMNK